MAAVNGVVEKVGDAYRYLFIEISDPRTRDWPLLGSPVVLLGVLIVYYHYVRFSGPKFMEKRKPYDIKNFMIFYNAAQCIVNAWASVQGLKIMLHPQYDLRCSPVDFSTSPFSLKIAYLSYIYLLVKILDLLDTIFMVLRKNYHQITFLHVYHHMGMVVGPWMIIKYCPSAHLALVGFLNCIVHTVMYFYYLLTAYDKDIKKSLWWKKHITEMQMGQFFLILVHHFTSLFNPNCSYPKPALIIFISQNMLVFYLFTKFYIDNYIKVDKKKD